MTSTRNAAGVEFASALRLAVAVGAVATLGVGLWLLYVTAVVLPTRDPAHIPLWRAVAVACLGYGALSASALGVGLRRTALRVALLVASAVAVACGGYGVARMLTATEGRAHFEGYILLMGLILCAHGLAAIAYALAPGAGGREAPAR